MRRRSVTVHCGTSFAPPAGAGGATRRTNACRRNRPVAVAGGRLNDGHVDDEFQAVVTWR